jgi:NAD(P)-dependent dehydrogenase (short-subunit alcohol dehydrogenase family)
MSVKQLFDLTGRVALITGGSRGLGLQIAEALGEMGAQVVITARKQPELDEASAHLRASGVAVTAIASDLQDAEVAKPLVEQVLGAHGRLDILVNNAGATWGAPAEQHPIEAWKKVLNLNLTAVFALAQAAAHLAMIPARYGRIVNIASVDAHTAKPTLPHYAAAKAAVVSLTKSLAEELAPHQVLVNAISPGGIATEAAKAQSWLAGSIPKIPVRRAAEPEDIAEVVAFLASPRNRFVVGETVIASGGIIMI